MAITINGTSGISGVDGSAGTPALQGSDPNTGISFGTDEVQLITGGTQRALVDSTGYLRLAGAGIQFNGDTAAANALDDYEEGLYTPSLSFSGGGTPTYNYQYASYVKIGNLVHVNGYLSCTSVSGTSGTVRLSGLPYATKNSSFLYQAPAIGWYSNLTGITAYGMGLDMAPNLTNHTMVYGNGTGVSGLNASNITNNFAIEWAFTYYSN